MLFGTFGMFLGSVGGVSLSSLSEIIRLFFRVEGFSRRTSFSSGGRFFSSLIFVKLFYWFTSGCLFLLIPKLIKVY